MTPSQRAEPDDELPAQDADVVRDADGLVVDEYSDEALERDVGMDALDQRGALDVTDVLDEVADDADMGLGAEPRSAEELEDAAIGHELKGAAGVTRDDEVHGERMFDSPDGKGRQTPEGEQD